MTITMTIPMPVVYLIAAVLLSLVLYAVGDRLLGSFLWEPLARRNGNSIGEDLLFWPYALVSGPIIWLTCLWHFQGIRRMQQRGRARAEAKRETALAEATS